MLNIASYEGLVEVLEVRWASTNEEELCDTRAALSLAVTEAHCSHPTVEIFMAISYLQVLHCLDLMSLLFPSKCRMLWTVTC